MVGAMVALMAAITGPAGPTMAMAHLPGETMVESVAETAERSMRRLPGFAFSVAPLLPLLNARNAATRCKREASFVVNVEKWQPDFISPKGTQDL